jgi:hypothetical protein
MPAIYTAPASVPKGPKQVCQSTDCPRDVRGFPCFVLDFLISPRVPVHSKQAQSVDKAKRGVYTDKYRYTCTGTAFG